MSLHNLASENDALDLIALNQDLKAELAELKRHLDDARRATDIALIELSICQRARDAARADRDHSDQRLRQLVRQLSQNELDALMDRQLAQPSQPRADADWCTCVPGRADVLTGRTP